MQKISILLLCVCFATGCVTSNQTNGKEHYTLEDFGLDNWKEVERREGLVVVEIVEEGDKVLVFTSEEENLGYGILYYFKKSEEGWREDGFSSWEWCF